MMKFLKGEIRNITFKILKHRRHSWIEHIIRHNEFVVNILEGAISGKTGCGKISTDTLKAVRQKHSS
jgi:hypothetical protein